MTKTLSILFAVLIGGVAAFAQMPGAAGGGLGSMDHLFDSTPVFSATMQANINSQRGLITATTKMYYDHGNSRTEMNVADMKGAALPPSAAAQMKAMGMDQIVTISLATKTNVFMVYPHLQSYIALGLAPSATDNPTPQITKLGEETVAGHPCEKNKVVVTDKGQQHEFTVWNATDLKNFPVQIAIDEQGTAATMTFQNVSFSSVPASEFQPPAGFTKYTNPQQMMQAIMASHASSMPGASGGAPNQ